MRFRTLVVWVVVLGVMGWAAYTIVVAGSSYLAAAGVVDQAVADAMGRRKTQTGMGMQQEAVGREFINNVRSQITAGARARGIYLSTDALDVSEAPEGVRVYVHWVYPVVLYNDVVVFNLPLSVTRSYSVH